jgi:hypothetical protein
VYYKSIFFSTKITFSNIFAENYHFLLDFNSGQEKIISYEAGFDEVTVLKVLSLLQHLQHSQAAWHIP